MSARRVDPALDGEPGSESGTRPSGEIRSRFVQRRKHERFAAVVAVSFVVDGEPVAGTSKDVSLGGMFVETNRPLPYGTQFSLQVKLPALPEPVEFDATVRWTGAAGMGVQWGALRAKETWALNQLMKR